MKKDEFKLTSLKGGVDDVFYNKFDRTWAKVPDGTPEPERVMTRIPIEVADDDGTVIYNYNNDFFRCDNFTKEHGDNPHILFAGCSQTEGVGAPLETVWTKVLLNQINRELGASSGFYSLGKSGFGWQKVVTSFMLYVDTYGAPDYLFTLLPNLGRFFEWDDESESFLYVQRYPNNGGASTDQLDEEKIPSVIFLEKPLQKMEHRKAFIDFSIGWKLFEKYCESVGTKLLWASWDYKENKNYELANISKNYFPLSEEGLMDFIRESRPDGKLQQFDLSRRDGHAGILVNNYWASEFKKAIEARGWL